MAILTGDVERTSVLGILARHPIVFLPPNDADFYYTSTAGNTLVAGSAFPNRAGAGGAQGIGSLPANANVQITVAGTFNAGKTVRLEFRGKNQDWVDTVETLVCTGTGAATQNFPTRTLWSHLVSVTVKEIIGTPVATELFTIGVGDGAAVPTAGTLKILNPVPGLAHANFGFCVHANAPTAASIIFAAATADGGRSLVMGSGTGQAYGNAGNSLTLRMAAIVLGTILGSPDDTVMDGVQPTP